MSQEGQGGAPGPLFSEFRLSSATPLLVLPRRIPGMPPLQLCKEGSLGRRGRPFLLLDPPCSSAEAWRGWAARIHAACRSQL